MMQKNFRFLWILVLSLLVSFHLQAQDSVRTEEAEDTFQNMEQSLAEHDSLLTDDSLLSENIVNTPVQKSEQILEIKKEGKEKLLIHNNTGMFYFLVFILLILGVFKRIEPQYYQHLFQSFISTKVSIRNVKSKIGERSFINTLVLILFYLCAGIYIYYIINIFAQPDWLFQWSRPLMITIFSIAIFLIYLVRIGFLYLLGWLFDLKGHTDGYIFNINLINQVMVLLLLPILFLLIFSQPNIAKIIAIASLVLWGFSIINRYARSRESIGQLIRSNKFHFFLYLCASEIMPFAILAKVIMKGY